MSCSHAGHARFSTAPPAGACPILCRLAQEKGKWQRKVFTCKQLFEKAEIPDGLGEKTSEFGIGTNPVANVYPGDVKNNLGIPQRTTDLLNPGLISAQRLRPP